jgi:hypothetical protein
MSRMRWAALVLTAMVAAVEAAPPPPWTRTETREPCAGSAPLRTPYFGDLHVHTFFSADAHIYGTRVGPRDAYRFARGAPIVLADDGEQQTRSTRLDRPLDFMAVTDHSEFFGETYLCATAGSPVYDHEMCQLLRQAEAPGDRFPVTVAWLNPAGAGAPPASLEFCALLGPECDAAAVSVWLEMQAAAEEAYDRTAACTFTSLIGYEHTSSPGARHLHRNIIFRNHRVPAFAKSHLETALQGIPQGIWSAVESDCLDAASGCDAVIIPHNPNLSGGRQFADPADAAEAARRQRLEPLVEIHQVKGNSECRFDRLVRLGAGTTDELCAFEQLLQPHDLPGTSSTPISSYPARNLVRNALKEGLALEQRLGANPFKFGFVGATDTHNATGGDADEYDWAGAQGNSDSSPERQIESELRNNPGGLTAVWAEENSRDAIFAALRRRETYATSGTRPGLRFFAGDYRKLDCQEPDLIAHIYAGGTPMGGDVGGLGGRRGPHFVVWALKDGGTAERPGTDLQRIQIVKGWVDRRGQTHERVFEVAGDPDNGATVDRATCDPVGQGAAELCTVWRDPTFKPGERAFYYARVLENPTCRWSTLVCQRAGVDPFSPECAAQAAAVGPAFADCCLGEATDAFLSPVVQERAWSSPIWYRPEAVGRVAARIRFGTEPGTDTLEARLRIGRLPGDFDPRQHALTLALTDDDDVFRVSLPAGTLRRRGGRSFVFRDKRGEHGGLRLLALTRRGKGVTVRVRTGAVDLSRADRSDHMVTFVLAVGADQVTHTRLWRFSAPDLETGAP